MKNQAEHRPTAVHVYDISGTGWCADDYGDPEEFLGRVGLMDRNREAAGLPSVTPLGSVPYDAICKNPVLADMLHAQVAAGITVYLVDFSQSGAALAAYHADLDLDGTLGHLPAGRDVQLIDTTGRTVWHAATVEEVTYLTSSIDWLTLACSSSNMAPRVRRY